MCLDEVPDPDWKNVTLARTVLFSQQWGEQLTPSSTLNDINNKFVCSNYGLVATYAYGGIQKMTFKLWQVNPDSYPYTIDYPIVENRCCPNLSIVADVTLGSTVEEYKFPYAYSENFAGYENGNLSIDSVVVSEERCEIMTPYDGMNNFPEVKPLNWNSKNYTLASRYTVMIFDSSNNLVLIRHAETFSFQEDDTPTYADIFLRVTLSIIDGGSGSHQGRRQEFRLVLKTETKEFISDPITIEVNPTFGTYYVVLFPDTEYWGYDKSDESFGYPAVAID